MWKIVWRFIDRIALAAAIAGWGAIMIWTGLVAWPMVTSDGPGTELIDALGGARPAVIACIIPPFLIATLYMAWTILKESAEAREVLRQRLSHGWYSRLDKRGRVMAGIDRLVHESRMREESLRAARAAILQLPEWRWLVRPALIGFIPVIGLAPILFTLALMSSSITFMGVVYGLGLTWAAATSAYWLARWTGFLDGRDRLPGQRKSLAKAGRRSGPASADIDWAAVLGQSNPPSSAEAAPVAGGEGFGTLPNDAGQDAVVSQRPPVRVLPEPHGFRWVEFRNAFFLQPEPWYILALEARPTKEGLAADVYATSPTRFSREQHFLTGFTLHVMSGMKSVEWPGAGRVAQGYMLQFICRIQDGDTLISHDHTHNGLNVLTLRYRDREPGQPVVIVHKCVAIDEALEMVWAFTFECPESDWERNWNTYGAHMIHRITIQSGATVGPPVHA